MGGESLFFEYKCDFKRKPSRGEDALDDIILCSAWCPREQKKPLLVIGASDGALTLFRDEGEKIDKEISRSVPPTCVGWGPAPHNFLATGWHDGAVSLWDEKSGMLREDTAVHRESICQLKWDSSGNRLVSADSKGTVGVWKADARGRLVNQCSIQKGQSAVTHVAYRTNDTRSVAARGGEEAPAFYFAGEDGIIYLGCEDKTKVIEVAKMEGPDASISGTAVLEYYHEKDQIVGINDHLFMMVIAGPDDTGQSQVLYRAKLSARALDNDADRMLALWVNTGLLLTSSAERMLRFWKISEEENFILRVEDNTVPPDDKIQAVAYSEHRRILAAGTSKGYVLFWFQGNTQDADSAAEDWQPLLHATIKLDAAIVDLKWAHMSGMLSATTDNSCYVLVEHELQRKVRDGVALVQMNNYELGVLHAHRVRDDKGVPVVDEDEEWTNFWDKEEPRNVMKVSTTIPITGCDTTSSHIVVWSGRKAEVFKIDALAGRFEAVSCFETNAVSIAIGSETKKDEAIYLYMACEGRVEVANLSGSVIRTMTLGEADGSPTHVDIHGTHLVVGTTKGVMQKWDVARNPPVVKITRKFEDRGKQLGQITCVRMSSDGMRFGMLSKRANSAGAFTIPDTNIFVYDVEMDQFLNYDCGPHHFPVSLYWDCEDSTLIGAEVHRSFEAKSTDDNEVELKINRLEVVTCFATPEGLEPQHRFAISDEGQSLVGLHVPSLFVCSQDANQATQVRAKVMRDFVGMERVDAETRKALLQFSYNLTLGNMDEAYKAVKLIKNTSVWQNMAHMCVKTGRLDVAEVCLSNMEDANGARAVREARKEPEIEARIAMVALQLGLIEDAEALYKKCKRFDLLNQMYQATGQWERAIEIADKRDRIHLKATQYNWGKHLEGQRDFNGARNCYRESGVQKVEVPRMLYEVGDIAGLESYCQSSGDKDLHKWLAQFYEANGKMEQAETHYEQAEDYQSMVRLKCFKGQYKEAETIATVHQNPPAAYFLASQYEAQDKPKEAIRMYSEAGRYNHAVRLARANGFDKEILSLALQASPRVMIESARYLEDKQMFEQAVTLYQKGGQSSKALEICFEAKLFDSLRSIADDLGEGTDPALLAKVGDFFVSHSQFDKAVQLFITCKQLKQAMDMCERNKVIMTEQMAEKITDQLPEKEGEGGVFRTDMLKRIADLCVSQQNYHLATKKYTQAGMKDKAMDALLKSGDTEKIIFFAGVLRSKEIYVRAANYLQTLNWHTEGEIMKKIIEFYTKARAYQQLAMFYDACSQVEIDEYRDYEKALGALKESKKFMQKAEKPSTDLDRRIEMVETFVHAKSLVRKDNEEFQKMCFQLLDQPKVDAAVQVGDVFALLIEFYYSEQHYEQAYQMIEKMRQRRIVLGPYLDQTMCDTIYRHMGINFAADEDAVDEDIANMSDEG